VKNHTKTLRFRLMASFSVIIIFCILLTSILGSVYYSNAISEQNMTYTLQLLEQVQSNMDTYIMATQKHMSALALDKTLLDYMRLGKICDENIRLNLETELRQILTDNANVLTQVNGLLVSCENGRYVSNEFYRVTKDPLNQEQWYQDAAASPDHHHIFSKPIRRNLRNWKKYSNNDVVMLTTAVLDPIDGKLLGTISVDLKLEEIEVFLATLKLGQKGTIFVMDEKGEVVYTPLNQQVYRVRAEWFAGESKDPFVTRIGSDEFTFLYSVSDNTRWKTIGMFLTDTPPANVVTMQEIMMLVAVVSLALGIFLALILTKTITKPIFRLQQLIMQAEKGDFTVHYEGRDSYDVDMLGNSFNIMITKIRALLSLVVEEQKNKRKAEIDALQAQINPHFLYNTLDTIHWMAKEYKATDIENIVAKLSNLFRIGLSHGNEFITLQDELTHVECYLYIQKIRYEDKLNYSVTINPSLLALTVPKLIVQPLVENAIYHGIKPKKGNGQIILNIYEENDILCIDVADNGKGIEPDKLEQLNISLKNRQKGMGVGLFNVNERIAMHFGETFGVTLSENPGGGIVSKLRCPIFPKQQ